MLAAGTGNPYAIPEKTAHYVVQWVHGAKATWGLVRARALPLSPASGVSATAAVVAAAQDMDYIGIWNERASDGTYVKTLRSALDAAG